MNAVKNPKIAINLYNGDYISFHTDKGKFACLIQQDEMPLHPRKDDDGVFSHMLCWHRR